MLCCLEIVAGQRLELVLIAVDEQRHGTEILCEVLHLGAIDQFLTLQHPAEQQADDDQYDRNFDEGEA
jgi:hypothetical protein